MKLDNQPRQSGKTTRLVLWAMKSPQRLIVVHNLRERMRLIKAHPPLQNQIMSMGEYLGLSRMELNRFESVSIDNIEVWINSMSPLPIKTITASIEPSVGGEWRKVKDCPSVQEEEYMDAVMRAYERAL